MSPPSGAAPYDEHYFRTACGPHPYERAEPWLTFFGTVADRILRDFQPASVLDAGCAIGLLVEALRDRGTEAYGVDISEWAIANVRDDIRPYCWRGSIVEPFPRQYDLIVTIETLEHLTPADAEHAIDNICTHTADVLFSSTPLDYREPTHVNVRGPEYWAELFGRNGFYRDVEYDASTYLAHWAVRFRRRSDSMARIVAEYERLAWRQKHELSEMRSALVTTQTSAREVEKQALVTAGQVDRLQAELTEIRDSVAFQVASRVHRLVRGILPLGTRRGQALSRAMRRFHNGRLPNERA